MWTQVGPLREPWNATGPVKRTTERIPTQHKRRTSIIEATYINVQKNRPQSNTVVKKLALELLGREVELTHRLPTRYNRLLFRTIVARCICLGAVVTRSVHPESRRVMDLR
jgi:hypothetical protein